MIIVHAAAAAEAQAARAWYSDRNPAAGERFLAEYDRAINKIQESPERWPIYPQATGFRWFHFRRFRYAVIYEVVETTIHILAVAADKRRPGYWRKRRTP